MTPWTRGGTPTSLDRRSRTISALGHNHPARNSRRQSGATRTRRTPPRGIPPKQDCSTTEPVSALERAVRLSVSSHPKRDINNILRGFETLFAWMANPECRICWEAAGDLTTPVLVPWQPPIRACGVRAAVARGVWVVRLSRRRRSRRRARRHTVVLRFYGTRSPRPARRGRGAHPSGRRPVLRQRDGLAGRPPIQTSAVPVPSPTAEPSARNEQEQDEPDWWRAHEMKEELDATGENRASNATALRGARAARVPRSLDQSAPSRRPEAAPT